MPEVKPPGPDVAVCTNLAHLYGGGGLKEEEVIQMQHVSIAETGQHVSIAETGQHVSIAELGLCLVQCDHVSCASTVPRGWVAWFYVGQQSALF